MKNIEGESSGSFIMNQYFNTFLSTYWLWADKTALVQLEKDMFSLMTADTLDL